MTWAFLPPSSKVRRLSVAPAAAITRCPVRVEPVIEILRMPGCATMAAPVPAPLPVTTLITPGGKMLPNKAAISSVVTGVVSAGL